MSPVQELNGPSQEFWRRRIWLEDMIIRQTGYLILNKSGWWLGKETC